MGSYELPSGAQTTSSPPTAPLPPSANISEFFENDASLQLARVICTQILMPIVCVVGVTGNVLNIIVLTRATMRSSTSCYLCAVAVYDLLYSLTGLPLTLRTYAPLETSRVYMRALTYLLPLGNMWSNATAWLTCAFTIERFLAISTPIRSRKNFSIRRTQWNIVFVSLFVALITLPDFFERKIRKAHRACLLPADQSGEVHVCLEIFYVFESTWVSLQLERFGWSYVNVALFVLIPLIILTIFNALLIRSVIRVHRERKKILADAVQVRCGKVRSAAAAAASQPSSIRRELTWPKWWTARQYSRHNSTRASTLPVKAPVEACSDENTFPTLPSTTSGGFNSTTQPNRTRETHHCFRCRKRGPARGHGVSVLYRSSHQDKQSITITLIAVVVVFCILNAPSGVVCLIRPWFKPSAARLRAFGNVSNLLLMLNASVNFFFYSLFSARFRRAFRTLLKRRGC